MALAPPIIRTGFTQGVKPSLDPSVVPENALWQARNARLTESGVIQVRQGTEEYGVPLGGGPIQGAISAFDDILVVWDGDLYRTHLLDPPTLLAEDVLGEFSSHAEMVRWSINEDAEFIGHEAVYLFGGGGIYQSDGTPDGTKLVEPYEPEEGEQPNLLLGDNGEQDIDCGPARSNIVLGRVSDGQRLVATGCGKRPNSVWMSHPLMPSYWPANQEINLLNDGSYITGLSQWYGALIIFRNRDIWAYFKMDETDTQGRGPVLQDSSVGCVAHRSIVRVPGGGIIFLGGPNGVPDNVYALTQVEGIEDQVRAEPIGDDIRKPLLEALEHGVEGVSAVYHDGEYRLSIPANPGEERVFRLNLRGTPGWFIDTGPRTTQYVVHGDSLYGATWNEGTLVKFTDNLTDRGAGIPFYVAFRRESLQPGPSRIKRIFLYTLSKGRRRRGVLRWWGGQFGSTMFGDNYEVVGDTILGSVQHLDVTVVVDGQPFQVRAYHVTTQRTQSLELQGFEPLQLYEARFRPSLKGHFTQLRVEATHPGNEIALIGYGIEYATKSRVRGRREGVAV